MFLPLLRKLPPQVSGRFPTAMSSRIRPLQIWLSPLWTSLVKLGPPPRGTTDELAEQELESATKLNLGSDYSMTLLERCDRRTVTMELVQRKLSRKLWLEIVLSEPGTMFVKLSLAVATR